MRRGAALVVLASLAAGCAAPAPPARILCLGDSITVGITRSASPTERAQYDPEGGFPRRLARRLGDRAEVVARAVGGATAGFWLSDPHAGAGQSLWAALVRRGPALAAAAPADARSVALGVVALDRPEVVVILLGANDIFLEGARHGEVIAVEVSERLVELRRQALTVARTALVSTVLPSRRDPARLRKLVNERIRADIPDYVPLGERFAEAGWEKLLGDEIHPNAEGYELLAATLAAELERRALVPAPNTRR